MNRRRLAAATGLLLLALVVAIPPVPVAAQTPTPSGSVSPSGCQQGQLCLDETPAPAGNGGGQTVKTPDAPAHFVRSLVTMALVGALLGAYLLMALTGKRPPFLRRRKA